LPRWIRTVSPCETTIGEPSSGWSVRGGRPAVDREHVRVALARAVGDVLAVQHPVEPGVPVLQRQEQLPVGRLVALGIDPEEPVHPHVDMPLGLVVAVVEVGPGDVRGDLVGV